MNRTNCIGGRALARGRSGSAASIESLEPRRLFAVTTPPLAGPWTQVLNENFDSLNSNTWTNSKFWWDGNATWQAAYMPSQAAVSNGNLQLTELKQPIVANNGVSEPLTSGMIQSGGIRGSSLAGFTMKYGYVDVSMQCVAGSGIWSALWMLPASHQDKYEVDVLENKGTESNNWYGGYHNWNNNGGKWDIGAQGFNGQTGLHDFAVDWEPGSLNFYADGRTVLSYSGSDVPTQPMYLILNLDANSSYAGPVANAPASASMKVDYIRAWQHTPSYSVASSGNDAFNDGSFETMTIGNTSSTTPSSGNWLFSGNSGIEGNGSPLGAANASDGTQAAWLEGVNNTTGSLAQSVNISTAGKYQVNLSAAQRAGFGTQPISVSVDGSIVTTLTPGGTSFQSYSTPTFNLSAGNHTIAFASTIGNSGDRTSFIDNIKLVSANGDTQAPSSPSNLRTGNLVPGSVALAWNASSDNVGVTGYSVYRNGALIASLSASTTSLNDSGLSTLTNYNYTVIASDAAGNRSAASAALSITPAMRSQDVGSPTIGGWTSFGSATYSLGGSGSDIWNASDQFQFASQPISGNTTIIARVTSLTNTNANAKAAIMLRASTAANAAFVDFAQTPGGGLEFQYRTATGATAIELPHAAAVAYPWLKIVRNGNVFSGFYSVDGASYTSIGSVTIAMPTAMIAGLALSSHDVTKQAIATFDHVSIMQSVGTVASLGDPFAIDWQLDPDSQLEIV